MNNMGVYEIGRQYMTRDKWAGSEVNLGKFENNPSKIEVSMNVDT